MSFPGPNPLPMPTLALKRAPARLLPFAAALTVVLPTGCAHFKEWFPSHEDVFTPIAPNVGVARIAGKDTTWSLSGAGYELTSRDRNLLAAGQTALDGLAADFRGYFAGDPPTVSIVAIQAPRRGQRPDTAQLHAAVASGATPLFVRTAEQDRGRYGGQDFVVVTPVVRAWVAALASGVHADSTTAGTSRGTLPRWIATAIPALVVGSPDPDYATIQVAQHPDRIIGLRSVFSGDRPTPTAEEARDSAERANLWQGDGGRGGVGRPSARGPFPMSRGGQLPALSGSRLWDAEAISIAAFLAAKEGKGFVGQATRTLLAGGSIDDVLAAARVVPRDVDALDRAWRDWLAQQAQPGDRSSR